MGNPDYADIRVRTIKRGLRMAISALIARLEDPESLSIMSAGELLQVAYLFRDLRDKPAELALRRERAKRQSGEVVNEAPRQQTGSWQ
jgi:hypothetical protein